MIFFSNNLCYIKFFSEMYYHVFSTKADQKGGSIHKEKNLSTEIHILINREGETYLPIIINRHFYVLNYNELMTKGIESFNNTFLF